MTPTQESHVQATVICTKNIGIQPKIQSGSHDYEGISYILDVRFIILDMFNLQSTTKRAKSGLKREKPTIKQGPTLERSKPMKNEKSENSSRHKRSRMSGRMHR